MPKASPVVAGVLLSMLCGCGAVASQAGKATAEGASRVEDLVGRSPGDEQDAADSLRTAIGNLRGESIDFGFTMTNLDVDLQKTSGTYYEEPERWAATTEFTYLDEGSRQHHYTVQATSVNGTVYTTSDSWQGVEEGCWLAMRRGFVPGGVLAMTPDRPVYVSLLDELRPAPWAEPTTSGLMSARLPLREALSLLPVRLFKKLRLKNTDAVGKREADVVVEIADERLVGVTVTRSSLIGALEDRIPPRMDGILRASTFKVTYPVRARSLVAERPDEGLVMTQEDAAAGRGCRNPRSL